MAASTNPQQTARVWFAVDVTVADEAQEAVEYALMEAGALGTEYSNNKVTGYFNQIPFRESIRNELMSALKIYSLPTSAVSEMELREVADEDWLAEWKKSWQPVAVGERFVIAPPWAEVSGFGDRIAIRIEPGMAFGTGTHETTRLGLKAIEAHFDGGSFLDVGTGTGILAIAAAKLFPEAHVSACDIDADAVVIAQENARLNNVSHIAFTVGSLDAQPSSADCVCANLTTDAIVQLLPQLLEATCRRLILSGILATQLDTITNGLKQQGISTPVEIEIDGEWACVIV